MGEDKKRLKLPVWRSNGYADELIGGQKCTNPNITVSNLWRRAGDEVVYEPVRLVKI